MLDCNNKTDDSSWNSSLNKSLKNSSIRRLPSTLIKTDRNDDTYGHEIRLISFNGDDELDQIYKQELQSDSDEDDDESSSSIKLGLSESSLTSSCVSRKRQSIPAEFTDNLDRLNSLIETAVINYSLHDNDDDDSWSFSVTDPHFSLLSPTNPSLNDTSLADSITILFYLTFT